MNCNFFRIFACHLEKHKEQMKITKIRTKLGEFQTPVTTDLDLVVARMRSEETKKAADLIAHNAMASRLAMQEGIRAITWKQQIFCHTSSSQRPSDGVDSITPRQQQDCCY